MRVRIDVMADSIEELRDEIDEFDELVQIIDFVGYSEETDLPAVATLEGLDYQIIDLLTSGFYGLEVEEVTFFVVVV